MAGYEQTIIIGNVGRDPEMRYLQSGKAVTNFSVAVTTSWTDRDSNERREKTKWYRCAVWGKSAESANTHIKKGSALMVIGTVEANAYTGNDGDPKASLELNVKSWQFVGSRGESEAQGEGTGYNGADLDEIPF